METIVNKVSQSGILTFNLEEYFDSSPRITFDIKQCLFMGLILKEKDFREFIKTHDWLQYQSKNVSIICSADAIVPTWAYMLIASKLNGIANFFIFGNLEMLENALFQKALASVNIEDYRDKKMVIKGCGNLPVPTYAYVEITRLFLPVASSIMYGEPCSTVPVFKKKTL
jgi:hypothetical protein